MDWKPFLLATNRNRDATRGNGANGKAMQAMIQARAAVVLSNGNGNQCGGCMRKLNR